MIDPKDPPGYPSGLAQGFIKPNPPKQWATKRLLQEKGMMLLGNWEPFAIDGDHILVK